MRAKVNQRKTIINAIDVRDLVQFFFLAFLECKISLKRFRGRGRQGKDEEVEAANLNTTARCRNELPRSTWNSTGVIHFKGNPIDIISRASRFQSPDLRYHFFVSS